ncbi:MAG: hypothetical protein ACXVRW_05400 [Solirubrobacteraceae bacterium]
MSASRESPRAGTRVSALAQAASTSVRAARWGGAWRWTPLAFAAFYAVVLLATLPSVVAAIYRNADIAAAPEIGQMSARAPEFAQTVLGNAPWYSALWFEQLTRWVPGHRTLWELAPWILTLAGIALVAWAAARVAGRWAGAIIAVTCACAGATLLPLQFAWSIHAVAYVHICVLGAFIVPLALGPGPGRWWVQATVGGLVILVTGVGMASDKLVILGGLVPFAVAGAVLWWLSAPPAALPVLASVVAVVVGASVVAVLATATAHSQGVVPAPFPISLSAVDQLPGHVGDLVGSLGVLANGDFGPPGVSLTGLLTVLAAGGGAILLVAALSHAGAIVGRLVTAGRDRSSWTAEAAAGAAFVCYWAAVAVVLSAAFVFSGLAKGLTTSRYLVPVGYAVVVIAAVGAARTPASWRAVAVAAGASAIILSAAVSLTQRHIQDTAYAPGQGVAKQLARFAAREHLSTGYAGYWDASALTWELHDPRVTVYPVITCGSTLCPFPYHKINTWYLPRPLARSFFIVDSRLLRLRAYGALSGPPAAWGSPRQIVHLGPLTVYVYPYNLAAKLLPSA